MIINACPVVMKVGELSVQMLNMSAGLVNKTTSPPKGAIVPCMMPKGTHA